MLAPAYCLAMRPVLAALLFFTAACDRGPDVPTATENADLDEVAGQLDNAGSQLGGIDDRQLNGLDTERAAPESTAPTNSLESNP